MITFLTGNSSFEINRELEKLTQNFEGDVTRIDGSELTHERLIELGSSLSLFAEKRLVIIRDLALNKQVWTTFGDILDRFSDNVHIVLVESNADKRTTTYKRLQKAGHVHEFMAWNERDAGKAETWVANQAEQLGVTMDKKSIQLLVQRVGVDQWGLYHALEKLAVLDDVSPEIIENIIEAQSSENVFGLFDAALSGDSKKIAKIIAGLQKTEDPYRVLGFLSSQAFQLAALAVGKGMTADIAKDIGAHAFVLSRLSSYAKRLGRRGAKRVVAALAEADTDSKSITADQWLLIERALIKIATQ